MSAHDPSESQRVPITAPTAEEVAALGRVAAYLDRAASEVGTRLLARNALDGDARLLAALRESLLQGAGLCADLLELAAMRAQRQTRVNPKCQTLIQTLHFGGRDWLAQSVRHHAFLRAVTVHPIGELRRYPAPCSQRTRHELRGLLPKRNPRCSMVLAMNVRLTERTGLVYSDLLFRG